MTNRNDIIRDFVGCAVNTANKHYIDNLSDEQLRELVQAASANFVAIINAVTDANPEDKEQVESILREFAAGPLLTYGEGELNELLLKLTNDQLKTLLGLLVPAVSKSVKILLEGGDEKAILAVWTDLIRNPATFTILLQLILSLFQGRQ